VIAGESGSGKTTLARLIMKSIDQDSGKIIFDNEDISNLKGKELLRLRRKMQMILQDPYSSLDPRMKIFDIIRNHYNTNRSLKKHETREIIFSALKKLI
jgi:ABC-type glutathione transport system ATPase component